MPEITDPALLQQLNAGAPAAAPSMPMSAPPLRQIRAPRVDPMEAARLDLSRSADARADQAEARSDQSAQIAAEKAERDRREWEATHDPSGMPKVVPSGNPTEDQQKMAVLLTRIMGGASDIAGIVDGNKDAYAPGVVEAIRGDLMPGGWTGAPTRAIAGADRRAVHDSQRDMLDALLTMGTGAAYNAEQLSGQMASYFPQYGDTQDEIDIKNQRLLRLIEAAKVRAGPQWKTVEAAIAPFMKNLSPQDQHDQNQDTIPEGAYVKDGGLYDREGHYLGLTNMPDGPFDGGGNGGGSAPSGRDQPTWMDALAQGTGSLVEGIASIPAVVVDPLATTLGRALGYDDYTSDFAGRVRSDLGLPGNTDRTADMLIKGATAAGTGSLAARGASALANPGAMRSALSTFGATPARDTAAGAAAAAGGEIGQQVAGIPGQIVGSLAGGVAGYKGANALAGRGRKIPSAMMRAADELGVDMLPADVGGVGTRMASGAVGRTLGGIPLAEAAQKSVASAGRARDRIASQIGDVTDDAGAGQAVRRGFKDFSASSRERADKLYQQVSVAPESRVALANTRNALADITRGLQSNPELSRLWANHPRLRATLEALTPTDTRPAGQVQYAQASDSLKGAEDALTRAKEEAARNLSFEKSQATEAAEKARKAFDNALMQAREEAIGAQQQYDILRPQVVGPEKLVRARQNADAAMARFQAFANKDRNTPEVAQALKAVDDADAVFTSLRFREPTSEAVSKAQEALVSAKKARDDAFVLSRQMPQGGELSWQDMNRFRSIVGEVIGQPGIKRDGSDIAALRKLYGALSTDMEATAAQAGPRALQEFRRANQYWRGRESRIEDVFQGLFGNRDQRSDEAVFRTINSWAQNRTGDFTRLARTLRSMPEDEVNTIRATVIQRMGMAKPSRQEVGGEVFSPAEFSTQWNSLAPRAKAVLFPNKEHRESLNKFASLTEGMKRASEYQNFSNTALGANLTGVGLTSMMGLPGLIAAGAYSAGTFGLGKLLSSPRFARMIAVASRLPPVIGTRKLSEQLGVLATREPLLAADARGLQQYLSESIGQSPVRAAAGEEETNTRRVPVQ